MLLWPHAVREIISKLTIIILSNRAIWVSQNIKEMIIRWLYSCSCRQILVYDHAISEQPSDWLLFAEIWNFLILCTSSHLIIGQPSRTTPTSLIICMLDYKSSGADAHLTRSSFNSRLIRPVLNIVKVSQVTITIIVVLTLAGKCIHVASLADLRSLIALQHIT